MTKFEVHKNTGYTVMSNYHLRDRRMKLKTKGLLSLMLSLPEDWDYSVAGLVALVKDGKDSVQGAIRELEELGYLKRTQEINELGQFAGYKYDVYEVPLEEKPSEVKPSEENLLTGKPSQLNTNISITKELITKYIKDIVEYLNNATGKHYKVTTGNTKKHITARLNEGCTVDDFKKVIDTKVCEWGNDKIMKKYLRPSTLFSPTNFENYLNEANEGDVHESNRTDAREYGITVL